MIELVMAGMMSCNLLSNSINDDGDRDCFYICQDKSLVKASTDPIYQCPRVLYEPSPKRNR